MVDDGWDILTGNRFLAELRALLHRSSLAKRSQKYLFITRCY
jgi:hypothetical protein